MKVVWADEVNKPLFHFFYLPNNMSSLQKKILDAYESIQKAKAKLAKVEGKLTKNQFKAKELQSEAKELQSKAKELQSKEAEIKKKEEKVTKKIEENEAKRKGLLSSIDALEKELKLKLSQLVSWFFFFAFFH